jgi:protein-tyrosine-phosphatase
MMETMSTVPKIAVVCRYNQARSVISSAVLARYFPGAKILSAGVNAVDASPIPESILEIASNWGINLPYLTSISTSSVVQDLQEADLIVVAENEFIPILTEMGISDTKIKSMQDEIFAHAFIPFDPIDHHDNVVSVEIAKAVMTTLQHVRSHGFFCFKNVVEVFIPFSFQDFENGVQRIWDYAKEKDASLLFANFRAPDFSIVQNLNAPIREMIKINKNGVPEVTLAAKPSQTPYIIASRYELDNVEKFALSLNFEECVQQLAEERPLLIITGPAEIEGRQFAEPFLFASHATKGFPLTF